MMSPPASPMMLNMRRRSDSMGYPVPPESVAGSYDSLSRYQGSIPDRMSAFSGFSREFGSIAGHGSNRSLVVTEPTTPTRPPRSRARTFPITPEPPVNAPGLSLRGSQASSAQSSPAHRPLR